MSRLPTDILGPSSLFQILTSSSYPVLLRVPQSPVGLPIPETTHPVQAETFSENPTSPNLYINRQIAHRVPLFSLFPNQKTFQNKVPQNCWHRQEGKCSRSQLDPLLRP